MSASPLFEFALLSFISMFTMVNPIGVIPVYTAMTAKLSPQESHRVARKASLTALIILLAFALTGQWIFRFFSISVNSLRVVGGVIFFMMGYEMLQAHLSRTQFDDETNHEYINDISITPLGIPIICGPGAITTSILLMNEFKITDRVRHCAGHHCPAGRHYIFPAARGKTGHASHRRERQQGNAAFDGFDRDGHRSGIFL